MTELVEQSKILLIAVIQAQDANILTEILDQYRLPYSNLPSVGGFLRERNTTFLIGCSQSELESTKELLLNACKKRITFISAPIENTPLPIPYPTETVIGGISLFTLDLDKFEEIQ